jgi:hypothetical protein
MALTADEAIGFDTSNLKQTSWLDTEEATDSPGAAPTAPDEIPDEERGYLDHEEDEELPPPTDTKPKEASGQAATAAAPDTATKAPDPTPFVDPNLEQIPLTEALDRTVATLQCYAYFPTIEQPRAIALWLAHTYLVENVNISARLLIRAPYKSSGKTIVLELVEDLGCRTQQTLSMTPAVLLHKIKAYQPTICLDEADRFFEQRGEDIALMVGIMNGGYRRGATVSKMVPGTGGKGWEPADYPAYAAMALAGIGTEWPDTIMSRGIPINLQKKMKADKIERWNERAREQVKAFAKVLAASVQHVTIFETEDIPDEMSDRAQDNWRPLLAIADAAGGNWPKWARDAAVRLSSEEALATTERPELVALRDARAVFQNLDDPDFIETRLLLIGLWAITESGWNDQPRPLTEKKLAQHMKVFGIYSQDPAHRGGGRRYFLAHIRAQWDRVKTSDEPLPQPADGWNNPVGTHSSEEVPI